MTWLPNWGTPTPRCRCGRCEGCQQHAEQQAEDEDNEAYYDSDPDLQPGYGFEDDGPL